MTYGFFYYFIIIFVWVVVWDWLDLILSYAGISRNLSMLTLLVLLIAFSYILWSKNTSNITQDITSS